MSCWCGADTQQQDYPPFGYYCTAVCGEAVVAYMGGQSSDEDD